MKFPHRSARRLAATAATAALTLGLAAPALAQPGGRPQVQDDGKPAWNTAPLTISPSSGSANTPVTVRSTCEPSGPATSEAFRRDITLRASNSHWVGSGRIKASGLHVGRTYRVNVQCRDGVTLSTTFTYTAAAPSGGASAGFGGIGGEAGAGDGQRTALAVGGGIAVAGAVGYTFLARRRRAGAHY